MKLLTLLFIFLLSVLTTATPLPDDTPANTQGSKPKHDPLTQTPAHERRGVAYNDVAYNKLFQGDGTHVTWRFNWDSSSALSPAWFRFIPMLHSLRDDHTGRWKDNAEAMARKNFEDNGPDAGGSCIDVPTAVAGWKKHMEPLSNFNSAMYLGSPAVTNAAASDTTGLGWLAKFLEAYNSLPNSAQNFKDHIANARKVAKGLPIWVTEFRAEGTDDEIRAFLDDVMPWMDNSQDIHRYAYFMARPGKGMLSFIIMRFRDLVIVASLSVVGNAAPTASQPRQATTASERLGLTWLGGNSSLPKVLVLFTGGTIAGGSIYGALDDTQYGQLSQTGEDIIARNPYLLNNTQLAVSNWTTEDDGSTGTNDALVMNMTRFAHDALCSPDSDIVGAVYTHGTNSLEETAFLMDSLINCGKPIVGTGSMRPFTHLSWDGEANFFDAVMLAASPESRDRGLMVAFNARIIPGYWVTKLHSTNPDAFGPTSGGDLGIFINSLPVFFNTPSQPLWKYYFDVGTVSAYPTFPTLPKVDILYAAREFDGKLVLDAHANGADGVVIAGTGNGGVPSGGDEIAEAMEKGLQVVVGTRSPHGPSSPARTPTFAKSGFVHPIQARIMLQLAIASGMNMNQTIDVFEGGFRKAIGQPWSPGS
ncbi:hypothetical protein J4E80_010111 [Alternaria sp. BMP 0032]|nr:hypothetical protein J4E80_010111 [Alternaria sp. BMP 0032]